MAEQLSIDFDKAALQARDGMKQALDHAEEPHRHWGDRAYDFLVRYAGAHGEFISEDVSDAAIAAGEPQPETLRAWGQIYRKAAKNGVILQTGIGRSRRRHASVCPRWTSLIYKG